MTELSAGRGRAILDTSIVIDRAGPFSEEVAISAVTLAELHWGVLIASAETRPERLRRLIEIERRFDPLPVDEAVADSYGRVAATVTAIGRQPRRRTMDLLIAATAHAHSARLYTRNPDDFRGLENLIDVIAG